MPQTIQQRGGIILFSVVVGVLVILAYLYYPIGVDWQNSYHAAAKDIRHPYAAGDFVGMVWVFLALPHIFLPIQLGNTINLVLHVTVILAVIRRYKGGWVAILLVFTSALFLDLARTNNVDFIPLLAFLLPPRWGLPFLAAKPQVLGGAALIWWKRSRFSLKFFLPLAAVIGLSFLLWGWWVPEIAGQASSQQWNFAPFPLGIPLGIYLLYKAYQLDDEVLGASATPLLVPYFAPYSLVALLTLLACKYPRMAFYIYCTFWFYLVVESRRIAGG